jgi:hypothetical protein
MRTALTATEAGSGDSGASGAAAAAASVPGRARPRFAAARSIRPVAVAGLPFAAVVVLIAGNS